MDNQIDEFQKLNLFQRSRFVAIFHFRISLDIYFGVSSIEYGNISASVKSAEIRVQIHD